MVDGIGFGGGRNKCMLYITNKINLLVISFPLATQRASCLFSSLYQT